MDIQISKSCVLTKKYRPRSLKDLIGQPSVVRTLTNSLNAGRFHNAYLFFGNYGCGKTATSRILAAMLNCEKGPTIEPCGACKHCSLIFEGKHYDVEEMDAASNGKIDQVRELKKTAYYSPVAGAKKKVYIIDECLPFDAKISTPDGPVKIGELVDKYVKDVGEFIAKSDEENLLKVLSYDVKNSKIIFQNIIRFVKLPAQKYLIKVKYLGGRHTNSMYVLRITPNHKVYSVNRREYVEARHLSVSDYFVTFSGRDVGGIVSIEKEQYDEQFVYNIEVRSEERDNKNYFADGVLVSNCHSLTSEGEEALLKIIEEPPEHVLFILATTDFNKMRSTIVSRCQSHSFQKVFWSQIFQHLQNICAKEKITIEDAAVKMCSLLANGSVRDSLQYLDKLISYAGGKKITTQDAKDLFGLMDEDIYYKIINCIIGQDGKPNATEGIRLINEILMSGVSSKYFLQGLDEYLNSMLIYLTAPKAIELFPLTDADKKRISVVTSRFDIPRTEKIISLLREIYRGIIYNEPMERLLDQWLIDSIVNCHIKNE